jgi:hydrogenase/urease accessory protein HupE
MKKLKWWFRIVGAFYLLLGVVSMYGTFFDPLSFAQTHEIATNPDVVKAFVIGWSPFTFEMVGIATFMLWASRDPIRYLGAVWLLVWLEFLHGILDDMYLMANGFSVSFYIAFIIVHLTIIVTGILFARRITTRSSQVARLAVK